VRRDYSIALLAGVLGLLAVVLALVATVALGLSRTVGLLTFTGTLAAGIVTATLAEQPTPSWLSGLVCRFCGLMCPPPILPPLPITPPLPVSSSRGVFISYRRDDDAKSLYPRLLKESLRSRLENVDVFVDRDDIPPGADFGEVIINKLHSSAVLIALIGPKWYKRLDDPEDYVRLEIQTALERGVWVIPTLIDGARLPRRLGRPRGLPKLAQLQAFELNGNEYSVNLLADRIRQILEPPADRARASPEDPADQPGPLQSQVAGGGQDDVHGRPGRDPKRGLEGEQITAVGGGAHDGGGPQPDEQPPDLLADELGIADE